MASMVKPAKTERREVPRFGEVTLTVDRGELRLVVHDTPVRLGMRHSMGFAFALHDLEGSRVRAQLLPATTREAPDLVLDGVRYGFGPELPRVYASYGRRLLYVALAAAALVIANFALTWTEIRVWWVMAPVFMLIIFAPSRAGAPYMSALASLAAAFAGAIGTLLVILAILGR